MEKNTEEKLFLILKKHREDILNLNQEEKNLLFSLRQSYNSVSITEDDWEIVKKVFDKIPELKDIYFVDPYYIVSKEAYYRELENTDNSTEFKYRFRFYNLKGIEELPNSRPKTELLIAKTSGIDFEKIKNNNFDHIYISSACLEILDNDVFKNSNIPISILAYSKEKSEELEKYLDNEHIQCIHVQSVEDLESLPIEKIKSQNIGINIKIDNVSQLTPEMLEQYNIQTVTETIVSDNYNPTFTYSKDEYIAIYYELMQLLDGITKDMPERERAKEIFKRISENISYDYPAFYPKNQEEYLYSLRNENSSRSLKNGLLYKKCLCVGYADIYRNACSVLGLESRIITGEIINEKPINPETDKYGNFEIIGEKNGIWKTREYHAWTKIKIDGVWYNSDPCFSHSSFLTNEFHKDAFVSDKTIQISHNTSSQIEGPNCSVDDYSLLGDEEKSKDSKIQLFVKSAKNKYNLNYEETILLEVILSMQGDAQLNDELNPVYKSLFQKIEALKNKFYITANGIHRKKIIDEAIKNKELYDEFFTYTIDELEKVADSRPETILRITEEDIKEKNLSESDIIDLLKKYRVDRIRIDANSLQLLPEEYIKEKNIGVICNIHEFDELTDDSIERYNIRKIHTEQYDEDKSFLLENDFEIYKKRRELYKKYKNNGELSDEELKIFNSMLFVNEATIDDDILGVASSIFQKVPEMQDNFYFYKDKIIMKKLYNPSLDTDINQMPNLTIDEFRSSLLPSKGCILDLRDEENVSLDILEQMDFNYLRIHAKDLDKIPQEIIKEKNIQLMVHIDDFSQLSPEKIEEYNIHSVFEKSPYNKDDGIHREEYAYTGYQYEFLYGQIKNFININRYRTIIR